MQIALAVSHHTTFLSLFFYANLICFHNWVLNYFGWKRKIQLVKKLSLMMTMMMNIELIAWHCTFVDGLAWLWDYFFLRVIHEWRLLRNLIISPPPRSVPSSTINFGCHKLSNSEILKFLHQIHSIQSQKLYQKLKCFKLHSVSLTKPVFNPLENH